MGACFRKIDRAHLRHGHGAYVTLRPSLDVCPGVLDKAMSIVKFEIWIARIQGMTIQEPTRNTESCSVRHQKARIPQASERGLVRI